MESTGESFSVAPLASKVGSKDGLSAERSVQPAPVSAIKQPSTDEMAGHQSPEGVTSTPKSSTTSNPSHLKTLLLLIAFPVVLVLCVFIYMYWINPYAAPSGIRVTNLTDRSFSVSWVTKRATEGVVIVKEDNSFMPLFPGASGASVFYDDRDVSSAQLARAEEMLEDGESDGNVEMDITTEITVENSGKYYVHHVTISSLKPETQYYFKVGNGTFFSARAGLFADDEFTVASENTVTTHAELEHILIPDPTYGSVTLTGYVVNDGVVYMHPAPDRDTLPLSSVLNEEGRWYIDLSTARKSDGSVVADFDEENDVENMLVEAGVFGSTTTFSNPMSEDAPAADIALDNSELNPEAEEESRSTFFISPVFASPESCPQTDPCTVSPVDVRKRTSEDANPFASVVSDADFPNLETALQWAEASDSESWFLLLSGGSDRQYLHILRGSIEDGKIKGRPITGAIHLVGETVANDYDMPDVRGYVLIEKQSQILPDVDAQGNGDEPPEGEGNGPAEPNIEVMPPHDRLKFRFTREVPSLYFTNAQGSVENISFGIRSVVETGQHILYIEKDEAENIGNVRGVIEIENSAIDVKNCRFHSANGVDNWIHRTSPIVNYGGNSGVGSGETGDSEEVEGTSDDPEEGISGIRYFRVSAVRYENSSGKVQNNWINGRWAGGVAILGASSDVTVSNNMMNTRWFGVYASDGKADVYGNVIWATDARKFYRCAREGSGGTPTVEDGETNEDEDTNEDGTGSTQPNLHCPATSSFQPLIDYAVSGIVGKNLSSIRVAQNTVDGMDDYLKLENVSQQTVENNLWIVWSDNYVLTGMPGNNRLINYEQRMTELNFRGCASQNTVTAEPNVGSPSEQMLVHRGTIAVPLCHFVPNSGSASEQMQVGSTYADGWSSLMTYRGEIGCKTFSFMCTNTNSITCNDTYNMCLAPGETPVDFVGEGSHGCKVSNETGPDGTVGNIYVCNIGEGTAVPTNFEPGDLPIGNGGEDDVPVPTGTGGQGNHSGSNIDLSNCVTENPGETAPGSPGVQNLDGTYYVCVSNGPGVTQEVPSGYGAWSGSGNAPTVVGTGNAGRCTKDANGVWHCSNGQNGEGWASVLEGPGFDGVDAPVPIGVTPISNEEEYDSQSRLQRAFVSTVEAATVDYNVSDSYVVMPTSDGVYDISIPGKGIAENVVMLEDQDYVFFVDTNGNGQMDGSEEEIMVEGLSIDLQVDDQQTLESLNLRIGLNYISINSLPATIDSCEFIKELDNQSVGGITQIARFESGSYQVTTYRRDTSDQAGGDCFPVVPGRGYVIRAYADEEIAYSGYSLAKPAQVAFDSAGWHLIGVNGVGKVYTAESLIDSVDEVESLNADNVTRWLASSSKYDGLQKSDEGEVFGFDFPIDGKLAYFVRITEGSGVWTPE